MGLFSRSKKPVAPVVPTIEEQEAKAKSYVDSLLDGLYANYAKSESGEFDFKIFHIAGITNYCSHKDIGLISGVTFPQKDNPHDNTAIALVQVKNKSISRLYGYIPRKDKETFNKFVGNFKFLPFLGYIKPFQDSEGFTGIMGVIKVYNGNCMEAYNLMRKDAQVIEGAFKGYYKNQTLEMQELKLEWVLDRHFTWR